MKIAIIGYSGSGKSTTASALAARASLPVLHLDSVHFLPQWKERPDEECRSIVAEFLNRDSWVIDGNYTRFHHEQRMKEADLILFFDFNRFTCFARAHRRYLLYRGQTRPDLANDCPEKFDSEFRRWLLWEGRTSARRKKFREIVEKYPTKTVVLHNQRELDAFLKQFERNYL